MVLLKNVGRTPVVRGGVVLTVTLIVPALSVLVNCHCWRPKSHPIRSFFEHYRRASPSFFVLPLPTPISTICRLGGPAEVLSEVFGDPFLAPFGCDPRKISSSSKGPGRGVGMHAITVTLTTLWLA
uniref:Uncharacterized protein n=1 Tax=Glossina brevipalpis TaxID=37001 RepID=A0A1A9WQC4_9MUSC